MGITGLWDVLGSGTVVSLAEYAGTHFETHGRPLRIAIDEAGWRFNNLTEFQVAKIREKEPAANPVEKTILWRLLKLLKLNIQPLFVFDGPQRPSKRGRRGGQMVDYDRLRLLKQLLDHLGVPHYEAKGEAEAECAALQQQGVVDAVWTDDSDAFMFGCTRLIKYYKVDGQRQAGKIQIYEASEVLGRLDFDKESIVLFALLAGGDYDPRGLSGCGPAIATKLATRTSRLAHTLCRFSAPTHEWRLQLQSALRQYLKNAEIPSNFPHGRALRYYLDPKVSSMEELRDLQCLRRGWQRSISHPNLRILLRQRFNFSTREYLTHIAPIFMIRALINATTTDQRADNDRFAIQAKRRRVSKASAKQDEGSEAEIKITFNAVPAIDFDVSTEPVDSFGQRLEDWTRLKGKSKQVPWSPAEPVECEILECFLRRGLSVHALEIALAAPKGKRKEHAVDDADTSTGPSNKRPKCNPHAAALKASKKAGTSAKSVKETSLISASAAAAISPSPRFQRPPLIDVERNAQRVASNFIDLRELDDDMCNQPLGELDNVCHSAPCNPSTAEARRVPQLEPVSYTHPFEPGLVCDREALRNLRMNRFSSAGMADGSEHLTSEKVPPALPQWPSTVEVIDLT